ncbi:hypothetical protein ASPWEDRAFT_185869 [Aspergillus wentii DTO 134E9]|uniref:N-acetyltransferase domain-containing protein n=1 Tax=Aspergillus wentii DTO 134E9 TaxID=1073089 RepID=A0A1L9RF19_ASPWE|nr:uncharacterized protein ASPWEDRAFT_185869 [Aspergillus wentii DTO 134E9]KAI9926183.1 hypothetical protein MW887_004646 [Aspergillus wentii]OJJ33504.1 hypothetical protein ASPWEDRAFT_185869 [Aspergillus wentii DTO 134E9]
MAEFCFPVRELSSDRVKLTPFNPTKHAAPYFAGSANHPELYRYMSLGPFQTEQEFTTCFIDNMISQNQSMFCFAVIDKTKPASPADPEGQVAGMVSYMSASPVHLSAEVGFIITLSAFQRTHVTTHAVGLLVRYALDSPEQGGLGLRRMQWLADTPNTASLNAAKRMGFQQEGILRWNRAVVDADARGKGHNGREPPAYGNQKDRGRDTVYLSLCWDDWVGGAREQIEQLMRR